MPPKKKKQQLARKDKGGSHVNITPDTTRKKNYELNMQRALEKKLAACCIDHIVVTPADPNNFIIQLSTAAFELTKQALLSCLHLDLENPDRRSTRNIDYNDEEDAGSNRVGAIIRVRNWSAIVKPGSAEALTGSCVITINIYSTTSLILINGADAGKFVEMYVPVLQQAIDNNREQLTRANNMIGSAIKTAIEDVPTAEPQSVIDMPGNNPESSQLALSQQLVPQGGNITIDQPQLEPLNPVNADITDKEKEEAQTTMAVAIPNMHIDAQTPAASTPDMTSTMTVAIPDANTDMTKPRKTCKKCKANIKNRGAMCQSCDMWTHYSCESMSPAQIAKYEDEEGYTCKACAASIKNIMEQTPVITAPGIISAPTLQQLRPQQSPVTDAQKPEHAKTNTASHRQLLPHIPPSSIHDDATQESVDQDAMNKVAEKEKLVKAKERQLNKMEQSLLKQQIDQTEISFQNAKLRQLVSNLEEKVKAQDEHIHLMQTQLLAQRKDQPMPSAQQSPPQNNSESLTAILVTHMLSQQQQPKCQCETAMPTLLKLTDAVNMLTVKVEELQKKNVEHERHREEEPWPPYNRDHRYQPPHRRYGTGRERYGRERPDVYHRIRDW